MFSKTIRVISAFAERAGFRIVILSDYGAVVPETMRLGVSGGDGVKFRFGVFRRAP